MVLFAVVSATVEGRSCARVRLPRLGDPQIPALCCRAVLGEWLVLSRRTWQVIVVAVLVYGTVAIVGRWTALGEIFPFFSWDLFTVIPGQEVRATIYLVAVDGREFEEPLPFFETEHVRGSRVTVSRLAGQLTEALRRDPNRASVLREGLEGNHLPRRVEWSLVHERFDPVERWRSGELLDAWEVARFSTVDDPCRRYELSGDTLDVDGSGRALVRTGGTIEQLTRRGDRWLVRGWAGEPSDGRIPDQLVVFSSGRCVRLAGVGVPRFDVVDETGQGTLRWSGFRFFVSAEAVQASEDLDVVAVYGDGTAGRVSDIETGR